MADEPSNSELQRLVERNHKDLVVALDTLGQRMERYVLEKVYHAEHTALVARLDRLEEDAESDRKTARTAESTGRQNSRLALLTSIGAFLGAVALAALSAWIRSGGH